MPFDPQRVRRLDEIDRFADEIVRHPERAEALKAALRDKIAPKTVRLVADPDPSDPEDYWDNVPV